MTIINSIDCTFAGTIQIDNIETVAVFTKDGPGTFFLSGIQTSARKTIVQGGNLNVNTTLSDTVNVKNGGTFSGNATIINGSINPSVFTVENRGTVNPGNNDIGIISPVNYVQMPSDTYLCFINELDQSDRIAVQQTATLNGLLDVDLIGGVLPDTEYVILTAGNPITTTFDTVNLLDSNPLVGKPKLEYRTFEVIFTFISSPFFNCLNTSNEIAVGKQLLDIQFPTPDQLVVLNALSDLSCSDTSLLSIS